MPNEAFYTAEELAQKLRVNIMTVYRYIKSGRLNAYKIGKEFRIENKEFNGFLERWDDGVRNLDRNTGIGACE